MKNKELLKDDNKMMVMLTLISFVSTVMEKRLINPSKDIFDIADEFLESTSTSQAINQSMEDE